METVTHERDIPILSWCYNVGNKKSHYGKKSHLKDK
jgi:hypothetical protein